MLNLVSSASEALKYILVVSRGREVCVFILFFSLLPENWLFKGKHLYLKTILEIHSLRKKQNLKYFWLSGYFYSFWTQILSPPSKWGQHKAIILLSVYIAVSVCIVALSSVEFYFHTQYFSLCSYSLHNCI